MADVAPMTTIACVGIAVRDVLLSVDSLPSGAGKNLASKRIETGGGPAANAAATIAALGGNARFIGPVGDDRIGAELAEELKDLGVDTSGVRVVAGVPSSFSVATVDRLGERAIVNHSDPALFDKAKPIEDSDLDGVDAVLAGIRWLGGAEAALEWAKRAGVPGVLDFDVGTTSMTVLDSASHVVFSSEGLRDLTGRDDPESGLRDVAGGCSAWVAVTAGPDGTYWLERDVISHHPAFEVEVVDTLGAGDVYHGAFALSLAANRSDILGAIRFASAAAAMSCTRFGGRAGIPTSAELAAFLKEET